MTCGRVAVKINTSSRLQYPVHFQQPYRHEAQESSHIITVGVSASLNNIHDFREVVRDLVNPFLVYVSIPRPSVLKRSTGSQAVRRSVKISGIT